MKYIIQAEIDPDTGIEVEGNMDQMHGLVQAWQALNPIGMYFNITRRAMTIIVDVPNEDAFFEALHKTWVVTNDYPDVSPVADASEFEQLLRRITPAG